MLADRIALVPRDAADVVVIDRTDARAASRAIADALNGSTIMLVEPLQPEVTAAALRAGAAAVLSRRVEARELVAAIGAVAAGLIVLDPLARDALTPRTGQAASRAIDALTERERQVLAMLVSGLSNRRIAERLAVSENTIKAHVAAVLAKLGASTRTEAVTMGVRLGLVML